MTINDFLKKIESDIKISNKDYNSDDFYYMLKYLGVKKNKGLVSDIEVFYNDFLKSLNDSLVKYDTRKLNYKENATYYIAFNTLKKADFREAVKVYFPVKYEYMISALKTTFMYLIRNSIKATVKFHVKATNEGIVIRFYNKKDIRPFINYCNNNFILKDLLEKSNPFIATIYGIGLVNDDNTINTYMGTLSDLLQDYFHYLKGNNILDKTSDLGFLDYIMKRKNNEEDDIVKFNISAVVRNVISILNHESPINEKDLI